MKSILAWLTITCVPLVLIAAFAPAPDVDTKKVPYTVHANYFEARESGLSGPASYLAFTERESFERTFGVGFVRGKPTQVLPRDAFETRLVAAVIKRGENLWEFKVEKVTAEGDILTVRYQATALEGASDATDRAIGGTARVGPSTAIERRGDTYKVRDSQRAPETVKASEPARRGGDTEPATRKAAPDTIRIEPRGTQRVTGTGRDEGSATFSSPLVISIPKGKYAAIVFIENGRKVGTVRVEN